ncbi:MAG: molybdate ABC transporter substrate-binding protein [Phycisphaerae bacterium]
MTTAVCACDANRADEPKPLVLFAAASIADALEDIADRFTQETNVPVAINRGASGSLYKQIQLGAACDVFTPASMGYLDQLESRGLLGGSSHRILARNQLVLVQNGDGEESWPNVNRLLTQSDETRCVIANPDHAPAGQYAREALITAGIWNPLKDRLVLANDVRMAARYVADGAIAHGIVYATDARAFEEDIGVVYRFPAGTHTAIVYAGAVCESASNPAAAAAFLTFAGSPPVDDIWRKHGFLARPRAADASRSP